jgi:hypothetical protein
MANGRCRMHGGLSTGPRTPEGLERARKAPWRHGHYSAEAKAARAEGRRVVRELRQLVAMGRMANAALRDQYARAREAGD